MSKLTVGSQFLRDLVKQFPNAQALTLARRAYREQPEHWSSLEACRNAVRRVFGTHGKKNRTGCADKTLYRAPRQSGWSDVIPEPLVQMKDWASVKISGPLRALILSDIHLPFHDPQAVELALQYGVDNKADMILLNGDICDFYATSRFETDPKMRDFPGEIRATRFLLCGLRKRFPHAQIIYKLGNHSERYVRYLRMKAPELLGLEEFDFKSVMGLDKYDVQMVDNKKPILLGKLNVIHGHEFPHSISAPVSPARGLYLRAKVSAICGHYHQTSQHSEKDLNGSVVSTWSTGCLCSLTPEFMPLNKWNLGFAFVVIDKKGGFTVQNLRIVNGAIW